MTAPAARPPPRGGARPHRGAGRRDRPARGAGGTRGARPAIQGTRLPLRDTRPGRVPFGEPQRADRARQETIVRPGVKGIPAMNPLPAPKALDQFFLDARARLLDLAAILD